MNIRGSSMSTSASKKKIGEFGDVSSTDETVPLPNLGLFSTAGKTPVSGIDHAIAEVIDERLRQLVGLSESMDRTLEKIAELLEKQAPRTRPRSIKKKKFTSREFPKT